MRIAALLESATPPEQFIKLAGRAVDAGLDEVWLNEDYYRATAPPVAAALLASYPSLTVGIGAMPVFPRHAAVTAMEIATLNRVFPGRVITALGHGLPLWMRQMGVMPASPTAGLSERVDLVRALLDGSGIPAEDDSGVELALMFPAPKLEIWLAVTGPRMLEVSAAKANGTLFSMLAGPAYVKWARQRLEGAFPDERAMTDHRTAAFVLFGPHQGERDSRAAVRNMVAQMLARRPDSFMISCTPFAESLRAMAERGVDHLLGHMPDEWVDEFAVWGDEASCREQLLALQETGLDRAILAPVTGIDKGLAMSAVASLRSELSGDGQSSTCRRVRPESEEEAS